MTDWSDIEPGDRVALTHRDVGNITVECLRRSIGEAVITIPGWNFDANTGQLREAGWLIDRIDKHAVDTKPMEKIR